MWLHGLVRLIGFEVAQCAENEDRALVLCWIECFLQSTWDSDFSFNDPVFKEHGSSRIALDKQMAKWRLEFKDTDYGIRPSSMPALLPQSHHLLDVPFLPSSTTSPKKATGSSNEPNRARSQDKQEIKDRIDSKRDVCMWR